MKQIDKNTGTISRCKHFGGLTKIRNLLLFERNATIKLNIDYETKFIILEFKQSFAIIISYYSIYYPLWNLDLTKTCSIQARQARHL